MNEKIPIDIISGFLGSGKTTLINALLSAIYKGERVAIIENEFGEVDIDSALLPGDIEITKITGGCVCCTLKVSLIEGIKELCERFELDRIVIETTGVAKLSDVADATGHESLRGIAYTNNKITVVNPVFHMKFMDLLGAFYNDQIDNANIIYISRKEGADSDVFADAQRSVEERRGAQRIYSDVSDFAAGEGVGYRDKSGSEGGKVDCEGIGCKQGDDECKHGQNEYDGSKNGCESVVDECDHARNGHGNEGNGRNIMKKEHVHADKADDDEFYSFVLDVKPLADKKALKGLIERVVKDKLPETVFRIKGRVSVGGRSVLVQWVYGDLNVTAAAEQDSKLVVVVGRK
ncbi:MAG: hypothetical protein HN948_01130 [Clostridia bacterium]|jgi:G3E family GTPase|nr:hypothetical protein [Clostridia bacterium]MBT7121593.1 hypothetical protein [Clostridia bacterium]